MPNRALVLPENPPPTLSELPPALLLSANTAPRPGLTDEEELLPASEALLGLLAVLVVVSGAWWGLLMMTVSGP